MSAVLSPCGTYRYQLEREIAPSMLSDHAWGQVRTMAVIMVNPSTADAVSDDATIRKVMGFAVRAGMCRVVVGNLFAFRATDIAMLRSAADPIGPENDEHLRSVLAAGDLHVVAWGPLGKLPRALRDRWCVVVEMARAAGHPLHALAVAKDGHPCHPLMLGYDRRPEPWTPPSPPGIAAVAGRTGT